MLRAAAKDVRDPKLLNILRSRRRLRVRFSALTLVLFFGFVFAISTSIAADLAKVRVASIPVEMIAAFALILLVVVMTGFYVLVVEQSDRSTRRCLSPGARPMIPLAHSAGAQAVVAAGGPGSVSSVTVVMFVAIVAFTLAITLRSAGKTKSRADFYAAGARITPLQNGPRDRWRFPVRRRAARHLGAGLLQRFRRDGLCRIGFLAGWPILLFLLSERLRNLGSYTFADGGRPIASSEARCASRPPPDRSWWWRCIWFRR